MNLDKEDDEDEDEMEGDGMQDKEAEWFEKLEKALAQCAKCGTEKS